MTAAASTASYLQRELDQQFSAKPSQPSSSFGDGVLPALSPIRTYRTPATQTPNNANTASVANVVDSSETRSAARDAAGLQLALEGSEAAPAHREAGERQPPPHQSPSAEETIGRPAQLGSRPRVSSLFRDFIVTNKATAAVSAAGDQTSASQPTASAAFTTPPAPRAPPTPPISSASTPVAIPTAATVGSQPTAPPTPMASSAATPRPISETPVPIPAVPRDGQTPRPAYKMKRTGKPGLPPGIPLSEPYSAPAKTLAATFLSQFNGVGKSLAAQHSPRPAAVTSDVAPKSAPPQPANEAPTAPATSPARRPPVAGGSASRELPTVLGKRRRVENPTVADARRRRALGWGSLHDGGVWAKRARRERKAADQQTDDDLLQDVIDRAKAQKRLLEMTDSDSNDDSESDSEDSDGSDGSDDSDESNESDDREDVPPLAPSPMVRDVHRRLWADDSDDSTSSIGGVDHSAEKGTRPAQEDEPRTASSGDRPLPATPIYTAPSGRLYKKWKVEGGGEISTKGAILPDLYKHSGIPTLPWICPIRSCRFLFPTLTGLGHHFSSGHRSVLLNDNLDGTLTELEKSTGQYDWTGARVVSQKVLETQDPILEPHDPKAASKTAPAHTPAQPGKSSRARSRSRARPAAAASLDPASTSAVAERRSASISPPPLTRTRHPASPHPKKEIYLSLSGRKYSQSPFGGSGYGVSLPDGYALSSYPGMPWICPVRNCRRVLTAIVNLGSHFTRQHRNTLFNDNGDGTLSKVGTYGQKRPIIVSQIRRSAAELEPLETPFPAGQPRPPKGDPSVRTEYTTEPNGHIYGTNGTREDDAATARSDNSRAGTLARPADLAQPIPANRAATWEYIKPFLTRTDTSSMPQRGYIYLFLSLPRVRDIHWNEPWISQNPFLDSLTRDVTSLLVQISGDYADEPCKHCRKGKGPYDGCVIVSKTAPYEMNAAFDSCANCLYHNGNSQCSLKSSFRPRFARLFPGVNYDISRRYVRSGNFTRPVEQDGGGLTSTSAGLGLGLGGGPEGGSGSTSPYPQTTASNDELLSRQEQQDRRRAEMQRRSERIAVKDVVATDASLHGSPADTTAAFATAVAAATTTATTNANTTTAEAGSRLATAGREQVRERPKPAPAPARDSPLVFPGHAQPGPEILEMEDWEVAPGRVQSGQSENVAFSNAYLTSNQMVPIDHNISYRVEVVRSGSSVSFDSDPNATRICSVAAGKLRVAVGDIQFVLGPHGMFKVKPGMPFTVENRLYIDAYMHLTAMHNQS